ncbi:MAG: tRNA threonylcarbamoyladenosine dehydratase [Bacteroidetes bacterium]|uniref:tRNA threonylcarbamoyladenosine dehydratase n=1 Tax=Candidatus Cryptobacteroides faecipullorum TaxID=2840764 RepID=A0A9D9I7Y7_9BACT|nr:tRNA threonylcarbamoyladenosine dehydratase [Candidatus Cryptobacteroides faecipullorum]
MEDWKERTSMLIGEEGLQRLSVSRVAVIGVGGVGGYAAEMVVRAGVGHLIIMDSDNVSVTNKNRQLLALDSTVGRPKCDVLRERLLDINPQLDIIVLKEYLEAGSADEVLGKYRIDFLIDAIDTLSPKMSLIKYCMDRGIPLVSSMGAGAKTDATKVRLADISKSFNCPLAALVRKRLRRMGIKKGFQAVFSEELPKKEAITECDDRNKKSLVGTVSYIPAVFGCVCAQAALQSLLSVRSPEQAM